MKDPALQVVKTPCLKRDQRTTVSEEFRAYATERLVAWRKILLDQVYPGIVSVPPGMLMDNGVIKKIACEGERFSSAADLLSRVRWTFGSDTFQDPAPNDHARALFIELQDIYNEFDKAHPPGEDIEDD